jgi:hypothetical protein
MGMKTNQIEFVSFFYYIHWLIEHFHVRFRFFAFVRLFVIQNHIFLLILHVYDEILVVVHRSQIHDDLIIVDDVFLQHDINDEIHDELLF